MIRAYAVHTIGSPMTARTCATHPDLLREAVRSIMDQDDATAADSFFTGSMGSFLDENVKGLDDFELVCFLVIRPATGGKS